MKKFFTYMLVLLNIMLYLVVVALWLSLTQKFYINLAITIFTLALTGILLFLHRKRFQDYYTSHHFRMFISSATSAFLIFCILGLVNYLFFKNPSQVDLTQQKLFTLTEQTKNIVSQIDGPVRFKIFSKKAYLESINQLIELYRLEKSDISIEKIDIDLRPDLVVSHNITQGATILVEYKDRTQKVETLDELHVSSALIRLTRGKEPVVYFTKGHGELDLSSLENEGGSFLRDFIEKSSYEIKSVETLRLDKIPEDAHAVVVWGPKNEFSKPEVSLLQDFMKKGGNLLVALDPQVNKDSHTLLRDFIAGFGLRVFNDFVIDQENHVNGSLGSVPIVQKFDQEHKITAGFEGPVFFPLASSLMGDKSEEVKIVAKSSPFPASWAESSGLELATGKVNFQADKDRKGPLGLMGVWEGKENLGRMVVFGNSTFVTNTYSKFVNNFKLFSNSLSWALKEDRLIAFNLPVFEDAPVFITGNQMGIIFYFSVVFAPLILFGTSFFLYRRRVRL